MAVVVVGGSGKDVGKTALVCAVISALRDLDWTAVKITAHDYVAADRTPNDAGAVIREETRAGEETDTERYLLAGARRAMLVTRVGDAVPIGEIRQALGSDRNVIFESNRIVDVLKPDVCVALVGDGERKGSFARLLRAAHAVVMTGEVDAKDLPEGAPQFELERGGRLPAEMVAWLRGRLGSDA